MHADVGYHHRPVAKRTSLLKDTFGKNTLRRKCCHRPDIRDDIMRRRIKEQTTMSRCRKKPRRGG
ncbi:hypothetical protein PoMZ_02307 [Pyricularia oryzae]|uniref:Uncharacterized protein n=1 Tax=Pyricularia oryzae TaxID=318829 RepID=A0A4P7N4S0_PYROR|nr:hypothetical protein PoMZ_02307 [Pyricularia oryzae]